MKIESQRSKEIEGYLAAHSNAKQGTWPIEIGGQKQKRPYYEIPTEYLTYNRNNGRLAMDLYEWEKDNGRQLDPTLPEDATVIRNILVNLDREKTEILKEDIRQKGQMEPGVVTHDGIVINGNRRMAVIELLHQEQPTGRWKNIEAVLLAPDISEQDLWKIEAGLQLSKDKVAEYHPVNELLKIREGIERSLSPEEVAAAMYEWTPKEVRQALDRLKLIDLFLEFCGQEKNYGLIKKFGLHEYFVDIQKSVIAPARRTGIGKREQSERLQYAFALIRAEIHLRSKSGKEKRKRITHWDIRKLDSVYSDPYSKDAFVGALKGEKKVHAIPPEQVVDSFRDAIDVLHLRAERDKPLKLIDKAIKALESIEVDRLSTDIHSSELIGNRITELATLVEKIRTRLIAGE